MKRALLTGVGREGQVGEAVAGHLADLGYHLILADRNAESVAARAEAILARGGAAEAHAADLTDPESVSRLMAAVGNRLDCLIHMAGGFAVTGPVASTPVEDWERQYSINLRTAFMTVRGALPALRATRGSVVFFSSESALAGARMAGVGAYAVAKTGVVALASAVAQEERDAGVRVNVLAPAAIRTASNLEAMPDSARFVEREDVAATVAWWCSDAASAVTGQVLRLTPR